MQKLTFIAATVLASALTFSGFKSAIAAEQSRVRIPNYRFSIIPPVRWYQAPGPDNLPIFVNFPWAQMQAQLRLPTGGAIIHLVAWKTRPRRRGDESLTGWARLDAQNAKSETVKSKDFGVPLSTGISAATIWSFDDATFSPDDQPQREVNIYWMFNDEKFACYLSYVVGDPKATQYQNTLTDLVASIRPI